MAVLSNNLRHGDGMSSYVGADIDNPTPRLGKVPDERIDMRLPREILGEEGLDTVFGRIDIKASLIGHGVNGVSGIGKAFAVVRI